MSLQNGLAGGSDQDFRSRQVGGLGVLGETMHGGYRAAHRKQLQPHRPTDTFGSSQHRGMQAP